MNTKITIVTLAVLIIAISGYALSKKDTTKKQNENTPNKNQFVNQSRQNRGQYNLVKTDEKGNTSANMGAVNNLLTSTSIFPLSEEEKAGLIFMIEEEKFAHDVYTTLGKQWNMRIFENISNSEQTHMDALLAVAKTYELDTTFLSSEIGNFSNLELSKLYEDLAEEGSASLENALRVGTLIEDLDIKDLQIYLDETENQILINVYENLQKGSRNHIRSFTKQLGDEYIPSYISQAEYDFIISSGMERGGTQ